MEPQHIIDVILGGTIGAYWWFTKTIYNRQEAIKDELAEHKTMVARDYATNHDIGRIEEKIDRILERMERKADKHHEG